MQFCDVDAQWEVQHAILCYVGAMSHAACNSALWNRDEDAQHAILHCEGARKRAACNSELRKRDEMCNMDFCVVTARWRTPPRAQGVVRCRDVPAATAATALST